MQFIPSILSPTGIDKTPSSKECSDLIKECFTGIHKNLCGEIDLITTQMLSLNHHVNNRFSKIGRVRLRTNKKSFS